MTEAVLDKETECEGDCKVNVGEGLKAERALLLFDKVVETTEGLELLGTANPTEKDGIEYDPEQEDTVFVIRNHKLVKGVEGAYVEVSVQEIIDTVIEKEQAMQFVNTILGKRNAIVLEGVTRIVGYYSRVQNWNKSKVGELRDRANGEYWQHGNTKPNQDGRMKTIDSL